MCQYVHIMTVHDLLRFLCFFFGCPVAKVCHLVGKTKEVKGHIQCAATLLPSCYRCSGPLQKSHRCRWQDTSGALLSVDPAVTSSAVDAWDSFDLCLSFLLLLLPHTWTFPFILHSYQSEHFHHKSPHAVRHAVNYCTTEKTAYHRGRRCVIFNSATSSML